MRRGLTALAILAACGTSRPGGPAEPDEIIADYRDDLDPPPMDCGAYHRSFIAEDQCPQPLPATAVCFRDAFATCTPAELRVTSDTIDAGLLPETWFVVPDGNACRITYFRDNSDDPYKGDYGDLIQYDCATLRDLQADDAEACPWLAPDECSVVQEWGVG